MIMLSPAQYATANEVLAALTLGGSFCLISSEPGFGLPTCMEYVRSRLTTPVFTIADHPELSGLDLLGQLYHQLHIDSEFQGRKEIPGFVVEIVTLREVSTIFIDHIDIFLGNESARRRTIQQIKSILTAFRSVNIVVSGLDSDISTMLGLRGSTSHSAQTISLKGFRDFSEYLVFFESILAEHSSALFADVSLEALYNDTKGNLGDTFLRLFHPAYRYKGKH